MDEENNKINIMNFDKPNLFNKEKVDEIKNDIEDNVEKIKNNLGLEDNDNDNDNNKINGIFENNNLVPEKVSKELNNKIDNLFNPPINNMNLVNNFNNINNLDIDNNHIFNNNDKDNGSKNDIFNDSDDNNNFDINNKINNSNNGFNDKNKEKNLNNINFDNNNNIVN